MPITESRQESTNGHKLAITKDMLIGAVVQRYPSLAEVLLNEGVHCVGCGAAYHETIEQGLAGHGKSPEEIDAVLENLNASVPKEEGSSETLFITEIAAKKAKAILAEHGKAEHGIRVEVIPGGCSGMQYAFDFENQERDGDTVIEVASVKFYADKESLTMLRGAKVDYVDSLQGAGFKISNPNARRTCGCGQSFR